eukprot:4580223-Amphidinium_carterae.2
MFPSRASSHHRQLCCKFLHTRRHNEVRDVLQRYTTEAGYTALAQQFVLLATYITQLAGDSQRVGQRGIERADLHFVSPAGQGQYIDILIIAVPTTAEVNAPDQGKHKRSQYRHVMVVPAVLSTTGQLAPHGHNIINQLTYEHACMTTRRGLHSLPLLT